MCALGDKNRAIKTERLVELRVVFTVKGRPARHSAVTKEVTMGISQQRSAACRDQCASAFSPPRPAAVAASLHPIGLSLVSPS